MRKKSLKLVNKLAYWLVTIGALNWGLDKFLNFNLVDTLLGSGTTFSQIVYGLVAISGVYAVWMILTKQLK